MSESENDYWSDVDSFPSHTKLVKNCLNMKTGKKREHAHIANIRSNAEIKLELRKLLEKYKSSSRVSTRSSTKKQADDFIIEFGSVLADSKENFMTLTKKVHDLIKSCNENKDQTINLSREMREMRQQIMSMGERMN